MEANNIIALEEELLLMDVISMSETVLGIGNEFRIKESDFFHCV